jgi:hypothetical protein
MVKRIVKRRIRNLFFFTFYGTSAVFLIIITFFGLKFLSKFAVGPAGKLETIKPVGVETQMEALETVLAEKNIMYEKISEASVSAAIAIQIKDGPLVFFSKSDDPARQVTSLQLILARLTIDNKKVTSIDLTGAKPIVKFSSL